MPQSGGGAAAAEPRPAGEDKTLSAAEFECLMFLVHRWMYRIMVEDGDSNRIEDFSVISMEGRTSDEAGGSLNASGKPQTHVEFTESRVAIAYLINEARAAIGATWGAYSASFQMEFGAEAMQGTWDFLSSNDGIDGSLKRNFPDDVVQRVKALTQSKTHLQVRCPLCDVCVNFAKWADHVRAKHCPAAGDAERASLAAMGFATDLQGSAWQEWLTTPCTHSKRDLHRLGATKTVPVGQLDADWAYFCAHQHAMLKTSSNVPGEDPRPRFARGPTDVPIIADPTLTRRSMGKHDPEQPPFPTSLKIPAVSTLADALAPDGPATAALKDLKDDTRAAVALIIGWLLEVTSAVLHVSNRSGRFRQGHPPLHLEVAFDDVYYDPRRGCTVLAVLPALLPLDAAAFAKAQTLGRRSHGRTLSKMVEHAIRHVFTPDEVEVVIALKERDDKPPPDPTIINDMPEAVALRRVYLACAKASFEHSSATLEDLQQRLYVQYAAVQPEGSDAASALQVVSMDSRLFLSLRDVVCTAVADGMLQAAREHAYGGVERPSAAAERFADEEQEIAQHRQHVDGATALPGMAGSEGWTFATGCRVLQYGPSSLSCVRWWGEALLVRPEGDGAAADAAGLPVGWVREKAGLLSKAVDANPGFEPAAASLAILKAQYPESFGGEAGSAGSSSRGSSTPVTPRGGRMPVQVWDPTSPSGAEAHGTAAAGGASNSNVGTPSAAFGGAFPAAASPPPPQQQPAGAAPPQPVATVPMGMTAVQRDALELMTNPLSMVLMWCDECSELVPQLQRALHQRMHRVAIHGVSAAVQRMLADEASAVARRVEQVSKLYAVQVRVVSDGTGMLEVSGHDAGDCAPRLLTELLTARFRHQPYGSPLAAGGRRLSQQ